MILFHGGKRALRFRPLFLFCSACLLLGSCQRSPTETALEIYINRLAIALSTSVEPSSLTQAPALPPEIALTTSPNLAGAGIFDPLSLRKCALKTTLIKRGSSLGKNAQASQRLLLQLEFLHLAPACIALKRQQEDTSTADQLHKEWLQAQRSLPKHISQATLAGPAFRAFWSTHPRPGEYPAVNTARARAALDRLNHMVTRWLQGDYRFDNLALELALGEIAGARAGHTLQWLAARHDWLRAADVSLHNSVTGRLLCRQEIPATRRVLLADATAYFRREVLPHSRRLAQQLATLVDAVTALEALLEPAQSPDYQSWRHQIVELRQTIDQAAAKHLDSLTQTHKACT